MKWILFFDGDCGFCSKSVQRVARFDKHLRISFAPLQGKLAKQEGFEKYASKENGSMVLWRESDGKTFMYSDSLIELARAIGGGWRIFAVARFIPKFLRDAVYRWVAKNRHHFSNKSTACAMPSPELLKRLRE